MLIAHALLIASSGAQINRRALPDSSASSRVLSRVLRHKKGRREGASIGCSASPILDIAFEFCNLVILRQRVYSYHYASSLGIVPNHMDLGRCNSGKTSCWVTSESRPRGNKHRASSGLAKDIELRKEGMELKGLTYTCPARHAMRPLSLMQ